MSRSILAILCSLALLFGVAAFPVTASAHPGNTDKKGCHTCRTNCPKWGLKKSQYHCHKAKKLPQPKAAIKSKLKK